MSMIMASSKFNNGIHIDPIEYHFHIIWYCFHYLKCSIFKLSINVLFIVGLPQILIQSKKTNETLFKNNHYHHNLDRYLTSTHHEWPGLSSLLAERHHHPQQSHHVCQQMERSPHIGSDRLVLRLVFEQRTVACQSY